VQAGTLLIAPEGIEIIVERRRSNRMCLLIAPEGIEIKFSLSSSVYILLLIAPEGIEILLSRIFRSSLRFF